MLKQNFVKTITDSLNQNWDRPAVSDYESGGFTYGEAAREIVRLQVLFSHLGLKPEQKVSLLGRNSARWAITYLAVITYGAVIVPILPDFMPEDVHHIVNHSDSVLLFAMDELLQKLDRAAMPHLSGIINLDTLHLVHKKSGSLDKFLDKAEKDVITRTAKECIQGKLAFPSRKNSDMESIVYTSGTTGFSKGVMLRHNSLMANVQFAMENIPLQAGDTILSFLPVSHSFGCAFEFLYPFSSGCHITFLNKMPAPAVLIKAFSQIRPSLILSVPLVIEKIYFKKILPKLSGPVMKLLLSLPGINNLLFKKIRGSLMDTFGNNFAEIIVGGAAFNPEVEKFLRRIRFPFTVGYGMTECGPLISYASWRTYAPGSVGRVVRTLEIRIDSSDPQHEVGEIQVKGENVMDGYYKNKEATQAVFTKDKWLKTGDLGLIDAAGNITIRGRSKTMLLGPGGQNIYPEEIEARLNTLPLVSESLIVDKDNRLIALVYPDMEKVDQEKISESHLQKMMEDNRRHLNEKLPPYSRISEIRIVPEEFDKTPKRSIKRYKYTL